MSTTNVIITQQVAGITQAAPQNIRDWDTGLMGCFEDIGSCLFGYFCMPCMWCSLASRLNETCCVPICLEGGTWAMRSKLRILYGIRGSMCNDCCVIAFCGACATCQMDRQLKAYGL